MLAPGPGPTNLNLSKGVDVSDHSTNPKERLARAKAIDAKLRSDIDKLVTGINSWPLVERRAFIAQWIDKLENENTPVTRMMADMLTEVWMSK